MANGAFQHRSGRVISLARLSLASMFLFAIWVDPSQPSRDHAAAYAVLATYALVSAVYLALTWNDWWFEHRTAVVAHGFDILLFGVMVHLTEGYTSPFFTFFVFIILSSTIRWGWKETAATSAVVVSIFVLAGVTATRWDQAELNITRLIVRGIYLIVLSLLLIWFSFNQRRAFSNRLHERNIGAPESGASLPIRAGLTEAIERTGAKRAALLWWDEEEPWLNLATLAGGRMDEGRHAPGDFGEIVDPRLAGRSFLFDCDKKKVLSDGPHGLTPLPELELPFDKVLATTLGLESGLAVPIDTETHGGLFILSEIPGLCADDIEVGERLGRDFSEALQQSSMVQMFEAAAASRTRNALSRDIHDSIVQLLSGTAMRLEGIRKTAKAGKDADRDLQQLQDELSHEQKGLRVLIGELRDGPMRNDRRPLSDVVRDAIDRASRQWGIVPVLLQCPDGLELGTALQHELAQLLREAIANAARHGGATQVHLTISLAGSFLAIAVRDNGGGFPEGAAGPRSLGERVEELGGSVHFESTPEGSAITMTIPWESRR